MTLDDIDQAFLRRLENWGWCLYPGRGGPCTSPTYEVCRRMALARGMNLHEGYRESEPRIEADEDRAAHATCSSDTAEGSPCAGA